MLKPTFSYLDFGFKVERFNSFNFVYISSPRKNTHNSIVNEMKTQVQQRRKNKQQGKKIGE